LIALLGLLLVGRDERAGDTRQLANSIVDCRGRNGVGTAPAAHNLSRRWQEPLELAVNALELPAEVLVEETIDDGVGACAAHADHVTDGVDHAEGRLVKGAAALGPLTGRHVKRNVEDVEGQPAKAENTSNGD